MKKYILQILPVLSILSMLQSKINFGKALDLVLSYYVAFRDFLFSPFSYIGLTIPIQTRNLLILLTTISFAFVLKGNSRNQLVVKGFIEGFVSGVISAVLFIITNFLSNNEELINKMDALGFTGLSIFEMGLVVLTFTVFLLVLLFFASFQFWTFALLFPFAVSAIMKIAPLKYVSKLFTSLAIETNELLKQIFPPLYRLKYMSNFNAKDAIAEFDDMWSFKEYLEYYSPLKDLVLALLFTVLVFKLIIENFL